jgi:tetratricopeptide (TPR) repeat protein
MSTRRWIGGPAVSLYAAGVLWFHFLFLPAPLGAQNAQTLIRQAIQYQTDGEADKAASLYEQAAALSGENQDWYFQAAECYYSVRYYEKAVDCYQKTEVNKGLSGLHFARAMKQTGQYEQAILLFNDFARQYKGSNKARVIDVVSNEIKGCVLAQRLQTDLRNDSAETVSTRILPPEVNSPGNEFAPIPFSDRLLYFSRTEGDSVRFMRTLKTDLAWQKAEPAKGLPVSLAGRFGNGAFSQDGKRFYCTLCEPSIAANPDDEDQFLHCEIYMLQKKTEAWSSPIKLPDYINLPGSTNMHPSPAQESGKEYLYFASNRSGSLGKLDLYVCERSLLSDSLDFSLPQNLGNQINTPGNEVTPFYDPFTQTLWFSSDGQVTLGGLDIFKSVRADNHWTSAQNAGLPLNSPADDLFYVQKKTGFGGYFISNRQVKGHKDQTKDQDIFEFYLK